MGKKAITRCVILGLAIGGVVGVNAIVHVLRHAHQVELAERALPDQHRTVEINYRGTETTIEIPADTHLSGPGARKELEAIIQEQVENDPKLREAKAKRLSEFKAQIIEKRMTRFDELESQRLKIVAECSLDDNVKEWLIAQVKQSTLANREEFRKYVDSFGK